MRGVPTHETKYFIAFIWTFLWGEVSVLRQQNIFLISQLVELTGPGPQLLPSPFCCAGGGSHGGEARQETLPSISLGLIPTHTLLLHFWWWAHSAWAESSHVWGIHQLLSFTFAAQSTKSSKFQCKGSFFPHPLSIYPTQVDRMSRKNPCLDKIDKWGWNRSPLFWSPYGVQPNFKLIADKIKKIGKSLSTSKDSKG